MGLVQGVGLPLAAAGFLIWFVVAWRRTPLQRTVAALCLLLVLDGWLCLVALKHPSLAFVLLVLNLILALAVVKELTGFRLRSSRGTRARLIIREPSRSEYDGYRGD
ncbi:MAG: hypothetical protein ACR2LF_08250 [Jatrophihabitantaceae bacterium]